MTAAEIVETFRRGFAAMEELEPGEIDFVVIAVAAHLRCLRPEQMSPLSVWEPTEPAVDPRVGGRQVKPDVAIVEAQARHLRWTP